MPSLARSLAREGYATSFVYGGDLNFTNQASYMYATGWQQLVWQRDLRFDTPPSDWGYDDAVMCDWFADRVIAQSGTGEPFLAGLLTLSSHRPFDVPFSRFDDRELNAFAFADDCVGRMIDKLKASPAWDDLLVVLVADHGYPWPRSLSYNEPLRHRIPMIWTGGAVAGPRVVEEYASQIDICATILGQLEVAHDDFDYSKDIFAPTPPQVRVLHLQRRLRRGRCFGRSRLGRHERESGFRDISRPDGRGPYDAADHLYRHRKPLTAGKIPEIRYCGT
ncbi:MAG: LTA synthase family protein [Alistipes finegoldii]